MMLVQAGPSLFFPVPWLTMNGSSESQAPCMWGGYLSAKDRPAVACIGNMQPSRMHQQRDGCGTWPGAFPCRPTQPAFLLRPFYILTPKVDTLTPEPPGAAFHGKYSNHIRSC